MSESSSQTENLAVFCREVRNLLRSKPNCLIPFSKFVPAYHNHYGRQCCVYQFGYTKLIELLEAIPHVVQILGDGSTTNRYITLTHREQIKRFASDLIKVVKSQPGKRLRLSQFARAYEQVLARTFRVEDYGTNNINVLLAEIWEGTINIIPIKRELVNGPAAAASLRINTSDSGNDDDAGDLEGDEDEEEEEEEEEDDEDDDDDEDELELEDEEVADDHLSQTDPRHSLAPSPAAPSSASSSAPASSSSSPSSAASSSAASSPSRNSSCGRRERAARARSNSSQTIIEGPLFVNVPLPKNPVLEQLVAQNQLVHKPYITDQYPDCWLEIPKRERSEREIKRTKYFVWDCIELLSKLERNNFSVPFSKFIPAYHYYFNRQCKVSIFGFSKLIDLFESIAPEVVEIVDQGAGEEKLIRLAKKQWPQRPIDCGPTEEELLELERELEDYEQAQCKRSTRMAAIF